MNKKKCVICGAENVRSSLPACAVCRQKDANNLLKAQEFCSTHPNANIEAISEGTSLPYKIISWYYENGKLGTVSPRNSKRAAEKKSKDIYIYDTIYGNYILLEISGKIDSTTTDIIRQKIDLVIEEGWRDLLIDVGSVTFFDSNEIEVFVSAHEKLTRLDGSMQIVNPVILKQG